MATECKEDIQLREVCRVCARVSKVEVLFWLWHRLKGPLLYTFP